ncbi:MAG: hypothetical protein HC919_12595 [Oscillatoriales cyanobacterium SM2_2_1]|nr:hypothetical protein [Oscillatoriales cyanobacterium SM2_2_1]
MIFLDFPVLLLLQIALIGFGIFWLLRRNDELPLAIAGFVFYVASYRYWAVTSGLSNWVLVKELGGMIDDGYALIALNYIVLGQLILTLSYVWTTRLPQRRAVLVESPSEPIGVLEWLRPRALFLGMLCLPLVLVARNQVANQVAAGQTLSFQVSGYLQLFPMVLIGVSLLASVLWCHGALRTPVHRTMAAMIILGSVYLTFGPSARFQFLGLIIGCGIVFAASLRPRWKLLAISVFLSVAMVSFAIAGAMRGGDQVVDLQQSALDRALTAEDGNMLDGFVILEAVYPRYLDFRMGGEHFEILLRPIPRALWPDKPVGGGYLEYLGLIDRESGFTLGVSPTLFGSFYAEGGVLGILIFSALYGWLFAKVHNYAHHVQPYAGVLAKSILCSIIVPLLRGGDLPGVYAWLGMAFWPCFLFFWFQRHKLALWTQPTPNSIMINK